ncbi:hypothetical protein [Amycolatopsis sp. NPDC051061]|uniref:hypothetical protein n=1 Tax=Amycolatopsis sp. NPDC051061 TaxID=3155042 RepID=UPI00343BC5E6
MADPRDTGLDLYHRYRDPGELTLEWWPDAVELATYVGAEPVRSDPRDEQPAAVLQRWSTPHGLIVAVWQLGDYWTGFEQIVKWLPGAAAYVRVEHDWDPRGPALETIPGRDAAQPRPQSLLWRHLARVLGQSAPYWPSLYRDPALITAWFPGADTVHHPGIPAVDVVPLLRMAIRYPAGHPAHRAMIHFAQVITSRDDESVDLSILAEQFAAGAITADQIALAADGAPRDEIVTANDLDETTRRIGWREVQARDDLLAEQCMRVLAMWDGGKTSPTPTSSRSPATPSAGRSSCSVSNRRNGSRSTSCWTPTAPERP